jgi:SET domain-containing protein
MGLGVFARTSMKKNTLIEISPVLVMSKEERIHLDQTLLHDYIFEWGEKGEECCMALGYVPIYNHSYHSNCEYEMIFGKKLISVKTVRAIDQGEELFINYNGNWNNEKKLWFDAQ